MAIEEYPGATGDTSRLTPEPAPRKPVHQGIGDLGATLAALPKEKTSVVAAPAPKASPKLRTAAVASDDNLSTPQAAEQFVQEMAAQDQRPETLARRQAASFTLDDPTRDIGNAISLIPANDLSHFRKLLNKGEITQELTERGLSAATVLKNALAHGALGQQVFHQGRQDPLGALDLNNDGKVTNYELAAHAIAFKADAEKGAPDSYLAKFAAKFGADKDHNELAGKVYAAMKSQPQLEGVDLKEIHDFGEKAVNVPRPQGAPPAGRGK